MQDLEEKVKSENELKPSLGDFTRKSVVGAVYRVGASFTMDAIYLTAAGAAGYYLHKKFGIGDSLYESGKEFIQNLDPAKLARVVAAVVLINFADYKFNITENLDKITRKSIGKIRKK